MIQHQQKVVSLQKNLGALTATLGSILCVWILFFGFFIPQATAQIAIPLSIKSSSNAPQPGQTITLTAETFSLPIESSLVTWRVNNTVHTSEIGADSITLTLGPAGRATTVTVAMTALDGTTANASRTFTPAEVTLIWEAATHTPPLYRGKARYTAASIVRFIALPHIVENNRTYTVDELIFTWKDNGKVIGSQSGLGKNVFVLSGTQLGRDMKVSVEVTNPSESILARSIISVERSEPRVLMYERTPLAGINFSRALTKNFLLDEQEVTLEVYPYFFSTRNRNSSHLQYTWRIDGESINPVDRISTVTLRKGEGTGTVPVSLSIRNIREILQRASAALTVTIGAK